MRRREFLKWAATAAAGMAGVGCQSSLSPFGAQASKRRPNIVFILADDLGYTDLSSAGSDLYETPNIDRLVQESLYFTRAYTSAPTCAPSRAAILTGKYPARLQIVSHGDLGTVTGGSVEMPLEERTVAEVLRDAGYTTAHVGKWHIGSDEKSPANQGFQYDYLSNEFCCIGSYFYPYNGDDWLPEEKANAARLPDVDESMRGKHLTDVVADKAAEFVREHKDETFFLNVPFYAVHTPLEAEQERIEKYEGKLRPNLEHQNATYAALVEHLDRGVGRILDAIKQSGLEDDTIVIFFSDNGGAVYMDQRITKMPITSNHPLRDGKVTQYEGGVRVPMCVKWPGVTQPGSICQERVIGHDFFPTLLSMAGVSESSPAREGIDGLDLTGLIHDPSGHLDRDMFCWLRYPMLIHYRKDMEQKRGPAGSILKGDWKLIEFLPTPHGLTHQFELYNLKDDPSEQYNLASQRPDKVEELKQAMYQWRRDVHAPSYDIAYREYEKVR